MNNTLNNKLIAVVRIRGRVNVRANIKETMKRLNLNYVNNCVLLNVTDSYFGMIKQCENYVAYGEINKENLAALLAKNEIKQSAEDILANKADINTLKAVFRLHPPRHGFKSTKLNFKQGGSLGYMGEHINDLINRMV
ncbi:MAG: uL30 family ribosomal protein [Candidatus Marsarchaeota archaeon]|nr:uL30 family ribosomal protein [Candidatus Marsarchaeota archaeon]